MSRRVIGERLSDRNNSLNFLRLVLATMVIVGHASPIDRAGHDIIFGYTGIATVAVYGFFGISGYLIAGSAERNFIGRYLWQRFLRIFPGFWVAIILTALAFGPLAWIATGPHGHHAFFSQPDGPITYIIKDWFLWIGQTNIHLVMENASIWTLFYEFLCYLLLGALAITGILRHRILVLALAGGFWFVQAWITASPNTYNATHGWVQMNFIKFTVVFLSGSLIYLYRDRIPDSGALALGSGVVFLATLWLAPAHDQLPAYNFTGSDLFTPFVVYPLLWLGVHLPMQRIGARNDYSYGIYIYAFPVQVLLIERGFLWTSWPLCFLTVLATIPIAIASWHLVEKQSMKWRNLGRGYEKASGLDPGGDLSLDPSTPG